MFIADARELVTEQKLLVLNFSLPCMKPKLRGCLMRPSNFSLPGGRILA
jgi:hypothetical protein